MRFAAVLATAVTLIPSTGWTQTKLGDVAGTIKLNPEAIVEQSGWVDDPRTATRTDQRLLGEVLATCSATADALGGLVEEARATVLYRGEDLPARLSATSLDLDTQLQELYLLRLTPAFADALVAALTAAETCGGATAAVREELARRGVAFSDARASVARCRQQLDDAEVRAVAVSGSAGTTAPAALEPPAEPPAEPTDDDLVAARCATEGAEGSPAYEACAVAQYRGIAGLASRTAANEHLGPSVFDGIRELCAGLHPRDLAERDRCEVERMTAARLEGE
ncbi:MAG: hypothetical protein MUC56_00300 [Thermoanaerobaculales bacterium]|jgi:hypothetical protein|nr:hypothetical protein [Thermoanaerobaculales bacterium]